MTTMEAPGAAAKADGGSIRHMWWEAKWGKTEFWPIKSSAPDLLCESVNVSH